MTAAALPQPAAAADPALQQLLMRFTGALNRRRAYAASHPMVLASEEQLLEALTLRLRAQPVLNVGVAKTILVIDGEPYVTTSSYARELATRLHRRGVGAIAIHVGIAMPELRELLAWLAIAQTDEDDGHADFLPILRAISITPLPYDQLTLAEVERDASDTGAALWRTLAQVAAEHSPSTDGGAECSALNGSQTEAFADIASRIRDGIHDPAIARRTAIALMDVAANGASSTAEGRAMIGEQLHAALTALGASTFGSIIRSLGDRAMQQQFVSQVVEVIPAAAVAGWLQSAAQAQDQQLSHHLLRLMSKLFSFATEHPSPRAEGALRTQALDLVKSWHLDDPNPEEHIALLDRIALHERAQRGEIKSGIATLSCQIESSRLVQMALEIDVVGSDAAAASEALAAEGRGLEIMRWVGQGSHTETARRLRSIATSDRAIRKVLLTEPVDRLEARAFLETLDVSATDTLIDVLAEAEARGTRMIVRQRLLEFGATITPQLLARLDDAPWYLVRNILTLLHELHENGAEVSAAPHDDLLIRLLDHPQVQVRAEALRLLALDPHTRQAALRHALDDVGERVVILAMQTLLDAPDAGELIEGAIEVRLMAMIEAGEWSDTVRARVVRTVSRIHHTRIRDWLLPLVVRRSRILRRATLAEPTQTAVAALHALQRGYGDDAEVAPTITLALRPEQDHRWHARDPGAGMARST